jgi:hypothetical protein
VRRALLAVRRVERHGAAQRGLAALPYLSLSALRDHSPYTSSSAGERPCGRVEAEARIAQGCAAALDSLAAGPRTSLVPGLRPAGAHGAGINR